MILTSDAGQSRENLLDAANRILACTAHEVVSLSAGEKIFEEHSNGNHRSILLNGWACRYKGLNSEAQQIIAFVLPGEFCCFSEREQCGAMALTDICLARIQPNPNLVAERENKDLMRGLQQALARSETIMGVWLLNIGQRKAPERMAHLLCELATRMRDLGMADADGVLEAPITQRDLADSLGLTAVHVNRILGTLRDRKLISVRRGVVLIKDIPGLAAVAGFNGRYLTI